MVPEIWSAADITFFHFGLFFQNFEKTKANLWRYYYFTNVYYKWQSYDVWFLRHGVQQAELFVILDCFLPFHPPNNPKNQNFEKMKKTARRYYHFIHVYHKWKSYDVWFLCYGVWRTEIFVILDRFLSFYPTNN